MESSISAISPKINTCKISLTRTDCNPSPQEIYAGLDNPDADEKYAAIKRLDSVPSLLTPAIEDKLLKIFAETKNEDLLNSLALFFGGHRVKKAIPSLIEKLTHPKIWPACVSSLTVFSDPSITPALQNAFKSIPSKIIAVALLKMGDPAAYLDNFAKGDFELLKEPDERIEYANRSLLQTAGFGGLTSGSDYKTKKVVTAAKDEKPEARRNLDWLIDACIANKDSRILPFLVTILKRSDPKANAPFPLIKIADTFKTVASPKDLTFLLSQLKGDPDKLITSLVLDCIKPWLLQADFEPQSKKEAVETAKGLLKTSKFKPLALNFLVEIKEKSVLKYLKDLSKKDSTYAYSPLEVEALVRLNDPPEAEVTAIFNQIMTDKKYDTISQEERLLAVYGLAQAKAFDSTSIAFLKKIIEDSSSPFNEEAMALECLKIAGDAALLPLVLTSLKRAKNKLADIEVAVEEKNKRLRAMAFAALVALANGATLDAETITLLGEERKYWNVDLKLPLVKAEPPPPSPKILDMPF